MVIRDASADDVERMVQLAADKRAEYALHSPRFWRAAEGAEAAQRRFFERLVGSDASICLVHEADGVVDGFVIANTVPAPPVYDPGGLACMIDDFVVADASAWVTTGAALRDEAERRAAGKGAVLSLTVCGHRDEAKRRALLQSGSHIASEWYVRHIDTRTG